jgi:hypothetical protein
MRRAGNKSAAAKPKPSYWDRFFNGYDVVSALVIPIAKWTALPAMMLTYMYLEPDTPKMIVINPIG